MIRKLIALATALTFVVVLPTLAAATGTKKAAARTSGMITSWDEAMKQGTVRDSAGQETSFGWNETTKLTGTPNIVAPTAVPKKPPVATLPPAN